MRVAATGDFSYKNVATVNVAMNESAFETVQIIKPQCRLVHYHLATQSLPYVGVSSFGIFIPYQFLH